MSGGPEARLREAASVFDELVEAPLLEAARRLDDLAARDPELAAIVRELLKADADAGFFLEEGVAGYSVRFSEEPSGSLEGQVLGPYVLVSLLGRGGMGEVWVAERRDGQFEQRVALKLLKPGNDSEGIRRRFLQERQVLARLEHPNIARLLDGGETSDGRPYFVMELVEGEPITKFCLERKASLEERLHLVATCAEATAAAHRRLVVHRDIKPSNVLVNAEGRVKLLDFGIAKLLSDDGDGTQWTRAEERVLTPTYAAPEQILGELVTTATDVYALGAVLYELLTGAPPHDRTGSSAAKLASQVEHETLEKPSRAVVVSGTSDSRHARLLAKRLEGDVDAIVQKALRREPERRYAGAAEMAEDLRRHLAGQRVEARPDTFSYRAGKFVRRHRAGVAAAALVVLALVGGLTAALWQARIAQANARRAERVQDFLIKIFEGADPQQSRGEKVTALQLLTAGQRRIETELRSEPEIQAALYDALAQIQRSLGALPEAKGLAERALGERRRLFGADDPRSIQSLVTVAEVRASLADDKGAEQPLRIAIPKLVAAFGADGDQTIRAREALADVLVNQGLNDEALALANELLASRRRRFGVDSPEAATSLSLVGTIQESMSRYDDAEKSCRQAIAILDKTVGVDDPRASNVHAELAELLSYRGRRAEAEKEFAITLAAQRKTLGSEHPHVASTLIDLGFLYLNERRFPEADAAFAESLRIYRALGDDDAASALRVWALSLMAQEKYAEARQRLDECLAICRTRFGAKNQVTLTALGNLGEVQLRTGELAEAETTLREAITGLEEMFGEDADNLRAPLNNLGEVIRRKGRLEEASALHRRALAIQLKAVGPDNPAVPGTRLQLALDLLAQPTSEHLSEARTEIDQAMALQRKIDAEHPRLDEMLLASGEVARAQGDGPRSRQDLSSAFERLKAHHGDADPRTREARSELAAASR